MTASDDFETPPHPRLNPHRFGPYQTRADAEEHAPSVFRLPPDPRPDPIQRADTIRAACRAAGLPLGDYDEYLISELGKAPAEYVQVITALIARAWIAGRDTPPGPSRPGA